MISVQTDTLPLILIKLVVYIAPSLVVIKRFVSPIFYFEQRFLFQYIMLM